FDRFAEFVVDERGELPRALRRLDMRAWGRQRQHLHRDAVLVENAGAVCEVAMAADRDVVVARIVDNRVAVGVDGDANARSPRPERVQVFRWVVMVMKINNCHDCSLTWRPALPPGPSLAPTPRGLTPI